MRVMRSSTPVSNATAVRRLRTESGTRASVRSGEAVGEGRGHGGEGLGAGIVGVRAAAGKRGSLLRTILAWGALRHA